MSTEEKPSDIELARLNKWIISTAKPGDVVFLECPRCLTDQRRECLAEGLGKFASKYGIGVVLLAPGMSVDHIQAGPQRA